MSAYNVLKKAIEIEYKINALRYKFARKVIEKLRQRKSKLISVNISDYPTFVWNDLVEADIFLTPPSLSGHVEGWLAQPKFGIVGRKIIDVNWDELWTSLKPEFIYYRDVLDAIRNLMSYIVNMSFQEDNEITTYAGTALYGNYHGFYKLTDEGIVVEYYDPVLNETLREVVAAVDGSEECKIRNEMTEIVSLTTVSIECEGEIYETDYSPGYCGTLDQLISLVRQYLDKQLFCLRSKYSTLIFIDGPLEGIMINYTDDDVLWLSESGSGTLNFVQLKQKIEDAKKQCALTLLPKICESYGESGGGGGGGDGNGGGGDGDWGT